MQKNHTRGGERKYLFYYVILTILIFLVISQKQNLHIDELLSYGLANSFDSSSIKVDYGIFYQSDAIERLFNNYLSVDENSTFNYSGVWKNQALDVHPPFYYAILHTISSFFPGQYSIYFSGSINIIFALLTLYVLRKLAQIMFSSEMMTNILSVIFVFSATILSAESFFRMYIVSLFFTTFITYFFVKMSDKQWYLKDYCILFITSVLSALTHYYCVVYLVFICAVYALWLLTNKYLKHLGLFMVTMALSAVASIAIFPAMLEHVFSGYRGANSFDNFTNTSLNDYIKRLTYFYNYFNEHLFGSTLTLVLILSILISIIALISKQLNVKEISPAKVDANNILKWCLIVIPTLLYFFLVAKIAVYLTERYMVPIYATALISFIGLLNYIIKRVEPPLSLPAFCKKVFIYCICAIMLFNGWRVENWPYLFSDSSEELEQLTEYKNLDCLVLYDSMHNVQTTYDALITFNNTIFLGKWDYYWLADWDLSQSNELILMLVDTTEDELGDILSLFPNINSYNLVCTYGAGTLYYLN